MTNAQTTGLATMARAASVTSDALLALQKSIANFMDADMDILMPDNQSITEKQKSLLTLLFRRNFIDKGELEKKLADLDSYSKADANLAIKELLPNP